MSEKLFPSESALRPESPRFGTRPGAANAAARGTAPGDDALASFGSERDEARVKPAERSAKRVVEFPSPARERAAAPPVVATAPAVVAAAHAAPPATGPRAGMRIRIAAAVALGATIGLAYAWYRTPPPPSQVVDRLDSADAPSTADAVPPVPAELRATNPAVSEHDPLLRPSIDTRMPVDEAAAAPALQADAPTLDRPAPRAAPAALPSAERDSSPAAGSDDGASGTDAAIRSVIDAYGRTYDRLDAPGAALLWPGVDRFALARTFETLSSQRITFNRCDISAAGDRALAACTGVVVFVRRDGDGSAESVPVDWTFTLDHSSGKWKIADLTVR